MQISHIIQFLEQLAPLHLQENYDNAGLITGNTQWECTGVLIALDALPQMVDEAIAKNCNLLITHHPIVFAGLKKINGKNYVEQAVIKAIKNDVALYAIHTNLDNVLPGVNSIMADKLGLTHCKVLAPKSDLLRKLVTYVPTEYAATVRNKLFEAGAGQIGLYSDCSFNQTGTGTYKPLQGSNPFEGTLNQRSQVAEERIETIFKKHLQAKVLAALFEAHPYEEVAYDIFPLLNHTPDTGAGLIGQLPTPITETACLHWIKKQFNLHVIKYTAYTGKMIEKIALCGGAGSFLTQAAIAQGADMFITGDVKYHEFFDADGKLLLVDIGHYESEQFTTDWLFDVLKQKFTTFATQKTESVSNPVNYLV
jgi:dinuclear metal center YbgI/SA1388 family protein